MRKYLLIILFTVFGIGFFGVPNTNAEYCYNSPNRPIIGNASVFWGNPPWPYPDITASPTDVVRFSLEGTFPGFGGDCQGVVALFEIFVDGDPANVVRTAAGGLLPGSQLQTGPMGSWQWYVDWPINNRLFDGRYRFRTVALDGAPIAGVPSLNVLTIIGAGPPPPPPPPPPSCSTGFSPSSIILGQSTTQNWTAFNDADNSVSYSCTGNIGSGNLPATGSRSVTPTTTQDCTFTAVNIAGDSAVCSASVTVNAPTPTPTPAPTPTPTPTPPPLLPTATINCSSCNIAYDSSDQISWSSTNTTSCTVSPSGWTGVSGSQNTGNLTTNTVYTLDCTSPGGPVSAFTVVNVAPPVIPSNPPTPVPTPLPPPPAPQSLFDGLRIPNPFSGPKGIKTLDDLFKAIINFLYYIAGPIVVIMIITAGLLFLFARDDSNKVQTAKKLLTYAIIGLAIILIGRGFIELLRTILALGTP